MNARLFVDTNILIYAHDVTAGRKHELARELVSRLWHDGAGCLSVQVLQELYVNLSKKVPATQPDDAVALVEAYSAWRVHRPTEIDVMAAIDLHRRQQLSFWDAMVVISADKLGCDLLYTEDLNHNQRILGITIDNPFEVG